MGNFTVNQKVKKKGVLFFGGQDSFQGGKPLAEDLRKFCLDEIFFF